MLLCFMGFGGIDRRLKQPADWWFEGGGRADHLLRASIARWLSTTKSLS